MKTNNMISKVFKMVALLSMTLLLANCSKNNGSSSTTVGTYQMMNGICYQNVNGQLIQQSNTNLCYNNGANGYQMMNGICYQNVNGQLIQQSNTNLCYNNGGTGSYQLINGQCYQNINGQLTVAPNYSYCNGNNGGYNTQVCNGPYTDGYQWVQCGTQFNCSGYTLYNQSYQIVRCQ